MSGLCGWLGAAPASDPEAVLAGMTATLGEADATPAPRWSRSGGAALAVVGGGCGALAHADGGVLAAVDGAPHSPVARWQARLGAEGAAATLLAAYREVGEPALLELFHGPFALSLLDPARDRALLAIDRMGIHPMLYATSAGGLVFATSADALRAHPRVEATISPRGVYRYAVNFVSPAPYTIYEDCRKLLPAHALHWADGQRTERRYWRIPYGGEADDCTTPEVLREELFTLLERAVSRARARWPARESVGAFLSGGLDSSAVAGIAQRGQATPLPAFTIGFDGPAAEAGYDESAFAAAAVRHFGLAHHSYRLAPGDVADLLPRLAHAFDEPFGNSSVVPAYFCARLAREAGVGALLAGDGGDEIFGGNKRYAEQTLLDLYHRLPAPVRVPVTAALTRLPPALAVSALGKGQRYVARARKPMPERMLGHDLGPYARDGLDAVFTPEARAELDPEEPYALWGRHWRDAGDVDPVHAMLHLDTRVALADNDLRKVGRATALAGVAVAYPLLDEDLISFAARLPPRQLVKGRRLRPFFRQAMQGFLPREVLAKTKHGFGMPFAEWTRSDPTLRAMTDAAFARQKRRGIFRSAFLDRVLAARDAGAPRELTGIVWDILMLELWWQERDPLT